jgi:hypothetical protein
MKIKLLRNIGIQGVHTEAGTVVDVAEVLGLELVGNGRAELPAIKEEAEAKPEQPKKK